MQLHGMNAGSIWSKEPLVEVNAAYNQPNEAYESPKIVQLYWKNLGLLAS